MATKNIVPRGNKEGQLGTDAKQWNKVIAHTGSFQAVSSSLIPDATNTYDLGSETKFWRDIYVSSGSIKFIDPSDNTVASTLSVGDDGLTLSGNQSVSGSTLPDADNLYDLGSSAKQWKDLYINGTANIDTLTLTSGASVTTINDENDMSSDSATALATQQSIKAYVDSQVTAQDLDIQGDSGGALSIDLDSETLDIAGGTGISTSGNTNTITITTTDSEIVHDNLSGFVANEHIDHSSVSVTAGDGLTGGGTIAANRTINVVGGTGITANANDIATNDSEIVHDNLSGFVANEHIDHSGVTLTAGDGLSGGGTIASSRTFNVGAGTHITVNSNDVEVNTGTLITSISGSIVTTANVTSAGALMDSEVDADIKTLSLPASTTISTFGKTLVDDANASTARTTLGVDAAGTDNSTDVTLTGTPNYITIDGQEITRNTIDIGDDTNLSGGTGITLTGDTLSTTDSEIVHDNLSGFVANEHVDHSGVTMTAGSGLTGGGTIASTRTFNVGAGTGVTVNANDVAIGQAVATNSNVTFGSVTVSNDVTINGNLSVLGDATELQVSNLRIEDKLIEVASGSADSSAADGAGILIGGANESLKWNHGSTNFQFSDDLYVSGSITLSGNVDGRDIATDGSKLDGIEASADVTDTANVTSAGALMDSELTSITDVKALNQSVVSGATPSFTTTNFTDASNKRLMTDAQETKLDSVESNADVTDTSNVTAAGALMDSELTDLDGVKSLTVPNNTTISTFGASLVDDANASTARTTLGVDATGTDNSTLSGLTATAIGKAIVTGSNAAAVRSTIGVDTAGTDNSTDVTLAGSLDYLTLSGQQITRNAIDLTTDVTGTLPTSNTAAKVTSIVAGDGIDVSGATGDVTVTAENASVTNPGVVELATTAETTTGTDTARAVTPDGLKDGYQGSTNVTTLGTIGTGTWQGTAINQTYLVGQSGTNTGDEPDASATVKGIVELATTAETTTGTDATRAVTPDGLKDGYQGSTNVTTLGTIGTGTWGATDIAVAHGGTGASDAAGARSNLGVDAAGTDNSTNVTLSGTPNYITIVGQTITRNTIDIGDDTNLTASTGITLTGDTLTTNDGQIVHDNLSGFVANEHIDHSSVSITAGSGLTGGGTIAASRTINIGAGTGIDVAADAISVDVSDFMTNGVNNRVLTATGTDAMNAESGLTYDGSNLDVTGGVRATGDVIAFYSSDKRLKDNIIRIENPLEKVSKIGGYTYDWNDKQDTYEVGSKDFGVIAQEIQEVLPELVTERDNGYLAVKYEKIVPLLIESIKELKQEVDDIKQKCDCLNK